MGCCLSSRYENGIEDSRWPTVIAPVSLIFFSVPVRSCASAPVAIPALAYSTAIRAESLFIVVSRDAVVRSGFAASEGKAPEREILRKPHSDVQAARSEERRVGKEC